MRKSLQRIFFYVFQVFRFFYLCLTQKDNDLSTNTYESLTEEGSVLMVYCLIFSFSFAKFDRAVHQHT